MKNVKWNQLKNERLKITRGVSFDELIKSKLVAVKKHHKREFQDILLFYYKGYIWVVPFVQTKKELFLKTLYPSRKYTKMYRKGEKQ